MSNSNNSSIDQTEILHLQCQNSAAYRNRLKSTTALVGARALTLATAISLGTAGVMPAFANPSGGTVVGGNATIVETSPSRLDINQSSDKAIINWQGFSIAQGEHTNFNQPGADSIALNRVTGGDPSAILGQLSANGIVMLLNPNGVLFGESAQVDVAGILATTADIADADFMAGQMNFNLPGNPDAAVINRGNISAADGGLVALVAPGVENSGIISARLGRVSLAAGNRFTLDLYGDNLIELAVDDAVASSALGEGKALIEQNGSIAADGGVVMLTAAAAKSLVDSAINMDGVIQAQTAVEQNGEIVLLGGDGAVAMTGDIDVSGGGFVEVSGADVSLGGSITLGDGGHLVIDPPTFTVDAAEAITIVDALDSGAGVTVDVTAADEITVDATIDSSAQNDTDVLNFNDEDASPLTINLNQKILLGTGQTLTGDGTTVNVANTGDIQNGIDVAASGATVNVAAGTFTAVDGALGVIDKPLTLSGAGQGPGGTILDGGTYGEGADTSGLGNDWVRALVVQSDDVTIEDMRIQNYQGNLITVGGYGIVARNGASWGVAEPTIDRLTVQDVTFEDDYYGLRAEGVTDLLQQRTTFGLDDGSGGYATYVNTSTDTVIRANTVNNGSIWVTDATNALIGGATSADGNVVTDAPFNGIWLGQQFAAGTSSEGTIRYNTVTDPGEGGIVIWNVGGEVADGIEILDNTVTGAQNIYGEHGGISIQQGTFTNLMIARNTSSGNTGNAFGGLFVNFGTLTSATIENNFFTGNATDGVRIGNAATLGDVSILGNDLSGNTEFAANNLLGGTLDASGNWWGSADENVVAAAINGPVDFTPFLTSGTDTDGGTTGFQGDFSDLFVTTLGAQTGPTGRIQEGIDLVSGSTVHLGPGTFNEGPQILVDKDVNVVGAGMGATTVMPTGNTTSSGDGRGWWLVNPGNEFNLSDLTLDGAGFDIWQAIRHKGSGLIDSVAFKNIGFNPSTSYAGTAVAAFGGLFGPPVVVDVTNSTFENIGRIGFQYFGAGTSGTYDNNVYTGKGVGDWLDYGVEVGGGATAVIKNSTFTGNRGVASSDGSTSAGILVTTFFGGGSGAQILYNEIHDNTTGIAVGFDSSDTSNVHAHFNDISGNDMNLVNTGSGNFVNAQFNYWGSKKKSEVAATISGDVRYRPFFRRESTLNFFINLLDFFGIN